MEFDPRNNVIKHCVQGMDMEEKGKFEKADSLYLQAWNEASTDFKKFTAAHFVARHQINVPAKLKWLETALQFALKINSESVKGAPPFLYLNLAKCFVNYI